MRLPLARRLVVIALAALAGLPAGVGRADAEQQPAMLDVSINGVARGQTLVVIDDGEVWLDVEALVAAGVKDPGGDRRPWRGHTLVRLSSVAPGITYELDEVTLSLRLTVK